LPTEEWTQVLLDDCETARQALEQTGLYRQITLPNNRFAQWWVFPAETLEVVFILDTTSQRQASQQARLLLGGLSHELRTPIGTMLTHIEVLSVPNLAEAVEAQSIQLLKQEAGRMSKLVNQLLMLGRIELEDSAEHRPLDVVPLVNHVIAQTEAMAQSKALLVAVEADTPLPPISGDEDRLKQVFLNLLDNAIKYCQAGDRITISLQRDSQGVLCAVTDSGPGIAAEHIPHLTRHFYRATAQAVEGSGLGLAIVNEILRQHNTHLDISSPILDDKTGSRFSFILPAIPANEDVSL
ncbi:MAG: ATP-binding protein, partial [Chloroflexota bacterium]